MSNSDSARISGYRGRIAPSPTGHVHLGHARTFWTAQQRARAQNGILILRNEDLDAARCRPEFVSAMYEDLRWFGFDWQEGPDRGGPFAPYNQSERRSFHLAALQQLRDSGHVYPCTCSRKDIQSAASAPHAADDEIIYPGTCRPVSKTLITSPSPGGVNPTKDLHIELANRASFHPLLGERDGVRASNQSSPIASKLSVHGKSEQPETPKSQFSWRFRVPDDEIISFTDGHFGPQQFTAGRDFGDFVVWRPDDVPAYQLAVVVDDAAMQITEIVRGADLLLSTARQLLLYRALKLKPPEFHHCPLLTDESGVRLAKRHDALSLRALRQKGVSPESLRKDWTSV